MDNVFADLLGSDEFREEFIIAEAQARLSSMLDDKGMSRAELARRLDVSRARVSQIFSDEAQNLTLRVLIRSYLALGEEPIIIARSEYEVLSDKAKAQSAGQATYAKASGEGIAEALLAKLLESNVGDGSRQSDRPRRVTAAPEEWASSQAKNVVPFRKTVHG